MLQHFAKTHKYTQAHTEISNQCATLIQQSQKLKEIACTQGGPPGLAEPTISIAMQIERIKVELALLQKNSRRIRRKYWATRKSDNINNLRDAIQSNEWACAWRYAQLLSRSKNGPKKRIYGQVSQYAPLAPEWAENLALPGTKKGCLATEYNFEQRSCTFREDNSSLKPPSHYDYEHELHAKKNPTKL